MQEATPDDQASDHLDEDDNFFVKKRDNSSALTQLDEYLLSPSTETMTVVAWTIIKQLFFKQKTLPCQLALDTSNCSVQLDISSPQMTSHISDTNFENQLLLKLKKGFVQ